MKRLKLCKICGGRHYGIGLCKKCYKERYRRLNGEKISTYQKEWYRLNKDRISVHQKRYAKKHTDEKKDYKQNGKKNSVSIVRNWNKKYWAYNTGKMVHIAIAEKVLGRRFKSMECTHHIDGNGLNNRHSNLMICTQSFHTWLHNTMRAKERKALGEPE